MTKRMLKVQKVKKSPWTEAVANAVHILSQCSAKALCSVIRRETWSGRRPWIAHTHLIENLGCAIVLDEKRNKLNTKESNVCFSDIAKA